MKKIFNYTLLAAFVSLVVSCSHALQQPDPISMHIDSTVKPGDNFFLFANGKWFKQNPIPASEQANGIWQIIQDTINAQIKTICEASAKAANEKQGSNKQKIGDFFYSGMDSINLNKQGIGAIKADLDRIDKVSDIKSLFKEAAYSHMVAGSPMFSFWVTQDDKISSKYAVWLGQGGLSLPDRSYYFDNDARTVNIRNKFQEHVYRMYRIMGYDSVKAKVSASSFVKLETALAKSSRKREELRDPLKNYNKITSTALIASTPNIPWETFTGEVGLPRIDSVIVGQPEFYTALNGYLKTIPLDNWKDYLKYHLVRRLAPYLDDKTYKEVFDFYATTLRGVPEPKPRWKRVVEQTDGSLGELIGQVYVKEYLPKGTKDKLLEIGNAIREVYAERIKNLDWMSAGTKEKALKKLQAVIMKVGYPDKWKDMSNLRIDRSFYVHNIMNANRWETNYMISKYGKPVDRTEWGMYPQTYNAYYNPSNNEICVPGCNILVPGFERVMADDAILYSIIGGSTFGHELTHGFDDTGSKYDELGNLHNWWTTADSLKFYGKTGQIVKQYNNYVVVDSLHINGELTQGENIADLGGIMMGYQAFQKTDQYKKNTVIGGINPDQRFFLGYAMAWMVNRRPEALAAQVKSNEHSPEAFRVIGPLANMQEFYNAFGIKQGDAIWRPDSLRVKIW